MKSLVVVHTEMSWADPADEVIGQFAENNRRLFEKIGLEVGRYISFGDDVYYLGEDSKSPYSELIYPAVRKNFPNERMHFIPARESFDEQALEAKKQLMIRPYNRIEVAGITYGTCVSSLYMLLRGKDNPPETTKEGYRLASRRMGWQNEEFERVFSKRLNAHIREELTA